MNYKLIYAIINILNEWSRTNILVINGIAYTQFWYDMTGGLGMYTDRHPIRDEDILCFYGLEELLINLPDSLKNLIHAYILGCNE